MERRLQHFCGGVKTINRSKIMPKLIGRFFFKKTDNGNLIGEFSNNPGSGISTESADLIPDSAILKENADLKEGYANGGFVGEYNSTWQEDGKPHFAKLKIFIKTGSHKLFTLEWHRGKQLIFEGEGMLCDGILIGDYHD